MIRIRLGELLHSNYSRFNLARLFGLGNKDFILEGNTLNDIGKENSDLVKKTNKTVERYKSTPGKIFIALYNKNYPLSEEPSSGGIGISIGGSDKPKFANIFTSDESFEIKIIKEISDTTIIGEVQFESNFINTNKYKSFSKNYYDNENNVTTRVVGGKYYFQKDYLLPTQKTYNEALSKSLNKEYTNFGESLKNFMDPEKNAIVKSFKESGGQGLAGFIESMNFDWYDKVTWEDATGARVPKMCKVTLSFTPIHDITPGLDHFGINRAPIYPVGHVKKR